MQAGVRGESEKKEKGEIAEDVLKGLSGKPKKLPSKYLYNDEGSRLFEEIMDLKEYYPARCEFEILKDSKDELLQYLKNDHEVYVVDLGAGNGIKTFILLHYFHRRLPLKYLPIDISKLAIDEVVQKLKLKIPELQIEGINADYFEGLERLKELKDVKKLVLFLGSNIGNFNIREAIEFLNHLHKSLNKDDLVLLGFDLKKNPVTIRTAYNDSKQITEKFNFNILKRINEELGGNFDLKKFMFYPTYDPHTGEMKSFLISKESQSVYIKALDKTFSFDTWETIQTECSNKYSLDVIIDLAEKTNFQIENNFFDSNHYFVDSLWKVK
ncbi:MAG: L-histidine N(alpha)-methyltransferase [Cytophagaceae bacterium]|nr:L-histidine N(alpha)-methyltransferase [Cytophagaceae bacterium]